MGDTGVCVCVVRTNVFIHSINDWVGGWNYGGTGM